MQEILNLGQDKFVVVKPKGETEFNVAWINIKQTVWGKFVYLVYRDNPNVVVQGGKIDGGWEQYLNDPLEMEVYEYTGE